MDNKNELNPNVVLGIAAHPDDLDFGSSGSFAVWAEQGADVYYLLLTDGSKGSADPKMTSEQLVKLRAEEQRNAAKIIGAKDVFFLGYPDGMLEVTMELKEKICMYIRKLKPDVVVTMDPTVLYSINQDFSFINHSDHRAAGQAAIDSVFPLARDRLSFPNLALEGYEPHKVKTLLLTNFEKQNFYVDVSSVIDKKIKGLAAHASQVPEPHLLNERIKGWASNTGAKFGVDYAEGFLRINVMD